MRAPTSLAAVAVMLASASVLAQPSSSVAWDAQTLRLVRAADPQRGEALAGPCAACHGQNGIAVQAMWPSLAGQRAPYTYKQLHDFRERNRDNPVMYSFVSQLSDQDIADIAAWYASLPLATTAEASPAAAPLLVSEGDPLRLIPPCAACHEREVRGERDFPRLAGQQRAYLEATLRAYRDGTRANDVYGRMRHIAAQLTDAEIAALAAHYAAQ